ncbi:hypothetical protein TNCT_641461 [Trichonephila clavata]|uniref:Uncharacterized protein n=1 Tax=Trichonephila clavata TaxID=2740835 RepID=A0A8X6KLR4_TRICU|nr:hypothetical protein TNCT_641461 [Trichonephila clavata]
MPVVFPTAISTRQVGLLLSCPLRSQMDRVRKSHFLTVPQSFHYAVLPEKEIPQALQSCYCCRISEDVYWRKLRFGAVSSSSI